MATEESAARGRELNQQKFGSGPVIYWMSRDQRVFDNWGLIRAQEIASERDSHVVVLFCLMPTCGHAAFRHYEFMLAGLEQVERDLAQLNIEFVVKVGNPVETVKRHAAELDAAAVVCDFVPLGASRTRRNDLARTLECRLEEVDSRNIVPCWAAADKHVYAAFHLRNRYAKLLPKYLCEIPRPLVQAPDGGSARNKIDWSALRGEVTAPDFGPPITIEAGQEAAHEVLDDFVANRLDGYAQKRGLPTEDHQSRLSPYLHFGQLSAQRAVLTVRSSAAPAADIDSFVDETVVWRELSDNFCHFNRAYASIDGISEWARSSLDSHAHDPRDVIYDLDAFERADTHDSLWNAAQLEMVRTGKMHNYMRMYWAKKILEWSESPREAFRIAVLLNDRYELDGRDSNGYAGVAWSIGGVHDRPWQERAVYGKIRYMNANGARRKFDVDAYIRRVAPELLDQTLFESR
ncbi:MAG: deoxyribodipyrimidine photo-lyase [Solirubrobacterales bacterium]